MGKRFDVVVVGARCAGSPLAAMLAGRGLDVCVVDKAEWPSDTPSTHGIQPNGVRVLEQLGIADELSALTEPITQGRLVFDKTRVDGDDLLEIVGAPMLNLRRSTLDAVLADHARAAGAEVRTRTPVTHLLREDGRVTGVVTPDCELRAGLVVGADGTRSTVARLVGARTYLREEQGRAFVWGYFETDSAPYGTVWLGKVGDCGFLASPTDGGLFMTAVAISRSDWSRARRDLEGTLRSRLQGWPELAEVLSGARLVGKMHAMAHGDSFFRESAGDGWVLVGDAGHFKDPTPGQGIADALRQVEQLAPAVEAALDGSGSDALTRWWRWRDQDALDMYWFAQTMGSAGPSPALVQEMMAALMEKPDGLEQLVRVLDHALPAARVFHPGLVGRSCYRALRRRPGERRQILAETRALLGDGVRQQVASKRVRSGRQQ